MFDCTCPVYLVHRVVMVQTENVSAIHWQWCLFSVWSMPYLLGLVCIFALLTKINYYWHAMMQTCADNCCITPDLDLSSLDVRINQYTLRACHAVYGIGISLGPFHGAIAVPSVMHCHCRRRHCGHHTPPAL